jgi:predicted transcriptional regulator
METTIRINQDIKAMLDKMKLHQRETYNDIIWILLEDHMNLNKKTKEEIAEARKRLSKGEFYTQDQVEKMFGIK